MSDRENTSSSDVDPYAFERRIDLSRKRIKPSDLAPLVRKKRDWSIAAHREELAKRRAAVREAGEGAVKSTPLPSSGGWMDNDGTYRMGILETAARLQENGNLRPRARPSLVGREVISEGEIQRKTSYGSDAAESTTSSPPRSDPYTLRGRDGRAASAPMVHYESEDTGVVREGSPSPGPRDRRYGERKTSESDISNADPVENATKPYARPKLTLEERRERLKRWANGPPLRRKPDEESSAAKEVRPLTGQRISSRLSSSGSETSERRDSHENYDFENEPEPPVRLPPTWGKRAKANPRWLQKILHPEELENGPIDGPTSTERPRTAPDAPLLSVEEVTKISAYPTDRPASAQPINVSPEKSKMWDADLDFTAQSLQISTSPQLRVRSTKLDELRSREIQDLSARAVATSRLEEIRERNSEERSFNSESRTNTQGLPPNEKPISDYHMSILEEEGEKIPHTPITVFQAKDFEAYCKRNNLSFSSSTRSRSGSGSGAGEADAKEPAWKRALPKSSRAYQRKLKEEEDGKKNLEEDQDGQYEVLRQLARAVSTSPTLPILEEKEDPAAHPATIEESKILDLEKEDTPKDGQNAKEAKVPETIKPEFVRSDTIKPSTVKTDRAKPDTTKPEDPVSRLKTPDIPASSKSDVDPEERITAEAMLFELQDNRSEKNSIRAPSPAPSDDGQFDETPRPNKLDPLSLPTPRVTGAYIETPAPITRVTRQSRSISPTESVEGAKSRSELLAELAQESKSELIAAALSDRYRNQRKPKSKSRNSSVSPEPPRGRFADVRRPLINTAKPVSVAEDLRQIQGEAQVEDSTLDDFDKLLEAEAATEGQTTILEPVVSLEYDERGLPLSEKEVERRTERLMLDRMNQSLKATSTSIRDARHGIERLEEQVSSSFIKIAQPADNGTMYLNIKVPAPRLYIAQAPEQPGMKADWKFTWIGLILTLFAVWYLCESVMCAQFCHPVNSRYNTWQPSDPFFPWAIPTKLDQWTGEYASSGFDSVAKNLGMKNWRGEWTFNWYPLPSVPSGYKGGAFSADDWWLGRSGPIGIIDDQKYPDEGNFEDDEMI